MRTMHDTASRTIMNPMEGCSAPGIDAGLSASLPRREVAIKPIATGRPKAAPTHDLIAKRAYELYLARAAKPGSAEEDWRQAEAELRAKTTR